MVKKRVEDDLSELLEPGIVTGEDLVAEETPDRIFIDSVGTPYWQGTDPEDGQAVEYIRADAVRSGFTAAIWQAAMQFARRTAGQPTSALQRARDLIEEGR